MERIEDIRALVLSTLSSFGFRFDESGKLALASLSKEDVRQLHRLAREGIVRQNLAWIYRAWERYGRCFADGDEVVPNKVDPVLVKVEEKWQKDLFRLARFYWSIPYSRGFGRRLRYLVFDSSNEKLIGILGLQSPPLGLSVRDKIFNYPPGQKEIFVNQTMDAFTLGALPPYNYLLGGKLVAMLVCSNEIRDDYRLVYGGRTTVLSERVVQPYLVAVTTASAFGRSAIYNRLKYKNMLLAYSIGFTCGYGNFHFQSLYPMLKEYLRSVGGDTRGGYSMGTNRSYRIIRSALKLLGLSDELLWHGIRREVFLFRFTDNLEEYMSGKDGIPIYRNLPLSDLVVYWKERYLLPRSERVKDWCYHRRQEILKDITSTKSIQEV